jgi:pimeloyl-ACP methyl ester carboxylesterase
VVFASSGSTHTNQVRSLRLVDTTPALAAVNAWRARGQMFELDGISTFVLDLPPTEDHGKPALFVLHGFPTCSYDWRAVLPALARDRRVVCFDFVGFGLSSKPDVRYGIRLYADQAERVARAVGLDSVVLVTHDLGDTVGGELLARDLDGGLDLDVRARVLSNGSIYIEMAHLTPGQELLLALDDARADISGGGDDPGAGFKQGLASTFSAAHPPSAEELDAQWHLVSHNAGHTLLPRTIRYIEDRRAEQHRFTGAIERHPSPLGVVWGAVDPVAVDTMTARLTEVRPATSLVMLEDVGHYPMIEAPDRFAGAVRSLLAEVEPAEHA